MHPLNKIGKFGFGKAGTGGGAADLRQQRIYSDHALLSFRVFQLC
jgi:hypothetical protein